MSTTNEATAAVESPLGTEEEFAQLLDELVTDEAPRLFALVEEHGDRADGWILAWGMAFEDRVEVVGVDGGMRGSFPSTERAHWAFSRRAKIRLVWTATATSASDGARSEPKA